MVHVSCADRTPSTTVLMVAVAATKSHTYRTADLVVPDLAVEADCRSHAEAAAAVVLHNQLPEADLGRSSHCHHLAVPTHQRQAVAARSDSAALRCQAVVDLMVLNRDYRRAVMLVVAAAALEMSRDMADGTDPVDSRTARTGHVASESVERNWWVAPWYCSDQVKVSLPWYDRLCWHLP